MNKASPKLHILLVESDEHDRLAFRRALKKGKISCEITECERAEEALVRLRTDISSFDLVVSDYDLPGLSGSDLCKKFLDKRIPLPLVILIEKGSELLAVEARKIGVNDYIVKDFGGTYLDLLPVVLPDVVQRHADRLAREQAEEALRESKEKYRKFLQTLPDIVYRMRIFKADVTLKQKMKIVSHINKIKCTSEDDLEKVVTSVLPELVPFLDGTILDFNKIASQLSGYSPEELEGTDFKDIIAPEYLAVIAKNRLTIFKQKSQRNVEYELLTKAKKRIAVSENVTLIEEKFPFIIQGIMRDITGHKQMM